MASCKVLQDIPLRAQFRLSTGFPFQDCSLTTIRHKDMDFSAHMPGFFGVLWIGRIIHYFCRLTLSESNETYFKLPLKAMEGVPSKNLYP